jgi:hypothetical protein
MRTLPLVLLACFLSGFAQSTHSTTSANTGLIPTFELYSWRNPQGTWDFCLLHTTNHRKTVEEVFNEKCAEHGIERLKQRMSKLPRPSRIVWFDRLTFRGVKLKGSEGLEYPPKEVVDQVKIYCDTHSITLFGPKGERLTK